MICFQVKFLYPLTAIIVKFMKYKNNKLAPILVISVIHLSVLAYYSSRFNGNITGFLCIGDRYAAPSVINKKTIILENSDGYDGQFYFYISHDPFISRPDLHKYIDEPTYRYQRIMYPLLINIFSMGNPALNPYLMVIINLLAAIVGTYFIMALLEHHNLSIWYSLYFGLLPGFFLSTLRSCPGPVVSMFIVSGLYFYVKERHVSAVTAFSLAGLTREMSMIFPAGVILTALIKKHSVRECTVYIVPFLINMLWQIYIYIRLGAFSFGVFSNNTGIPFAGIFEKFIQIFQKPVAALSYYNVFDLFFITFIISTVIICAIYLIFRKDFYIYSILFLLLALIAVTSTINVWISFWSYGRVFNDIFVLLLLIFAMTKERRYMIPLTGSAIFSIILACFNYF